MQNASNNWLHLTIIINEPKKLLAEQEGFLQDGCSRNQSLTEIDIYYYSNTDFSKKVKW